jgi:hypothetical protein
MEDEANIHQSVTNNSVGNEGKKDHDEARSKDAVPRIAYNRG